jgi:ectoine hydroxylase-related dioxygenase (phytanoyl-CoA dioxygenase family)
MSPTVHELDAGLRRTWDQDGFFIIRGFFDAGTCDALVDEAVRLARLEEAERPPTMVVIPEGRPRQGASNPEDFVAKLFRLDRRAPFDNVARHPGVLDLVMALLGVDVDIFLSQFIFKAPEAYGQPWHQDSFYFPFEPDRQVGVWTAATRATTHNGCLWVLPGSHTEPVHEHVMDDRPNATQAYTKIIDHDMSEKVPVEMAPGDLLVFDSHLMHCSTDNESDEVRAAFVCHYARAGTKVLSPLAESVTDWQPLLRGGQLVDVATTP